VHLEKSHSNQIGPAKEKKPETKICEYCEDEVPHKAYTSHVTACRKYKGMIRGNECLVCKKSWAKRVNLLIHMRYHHSSPGFTPIVENPKPKGTPKQKFPILENLECPNCQALFRTEEELTDHVEICSALIDDVDGFVPDTQDKVEEEEDELEEDPLSSTITPTTKKCTFCTKMVHKDVLGKHVKRCEKASDLIEGLKCTRCPRLQLDSKLDIYGHVLKYHIPNEEDEATTQDEMDEVMTIEEPEDIPRNIPRNDRNEIQNGPTITEVHEPPRQPTSRAFREVSPVSTALVPRDYFVDVDPNIITKLYVCPMCKGKLARMDHVQKHVVLFHKIDYTLFSSLLFVFKMFIYERYFSSERCL